MTTCANKKHPCPDCRQCQHCSDSRCNVCLGQGRSFSRFSAMSMQEQIDFFEAVARGEEPESQNG